MAMMDKVYKHHKWVDIPETRYERRRTLNVRESAHTFMLFDNKHYDVETGKYILDKMPKLYCSSLADIIDDSVHNNMRYGNYQAGFYDDEEVGTVVSNVYNFPKHIPKDNDFDKEERRDKAAKDAKIAAQKERLRLEGIARERANDAYAIQLAEAEQRIAAMNDRRIYLGGPNHGQPVSNIKTNRWIPK